jgi:predicted MFS family arabinose efflux permease
MLLLSAVAQGAAFGFFGPARVAFSADLVGRSQLGNAIALSLLSMNGTRIFAPSLAGVLAGWALFGIGGAYLVAGITSVASMLYLIRLPHVEAAQRRGERRNPIADIVDGVRHVAANPPLRRLVLSSFFIVMFGFNYVSFYPAMIEGVFDLDDTWVGYISSASALGAVSVAVPLASRANSSWAKPAMIVGGICFGLGVIAFGAAPNFWVAFVVIAFVGAANTVYQTLSNTMALDLADDSHQGRVQSLMQLSFAGFGIAAAPLGLLAEVIGLRRAVGVMGIVALTTAVIYLLAEGGIGSVRDEAEALESERDLVVA